LISAASSGTHSWTVGHAFRQGDLPQGSYVTTNAASSQAVVRNRWPDGSVKYAVLSGTSSFTQNSAVTIQLGTTSTAPSSSTVAEPANLDVSVTLSGDVSGTYTLQSCLGVDLSTWNRSSAGRVRQILGPVMSEFHYYRPTTDAHVTVWFYVRRYASGETEVETVVENGWWQVASPGQRNYTVSVNVGGATKFSSTLNHYHHTRWSRVDWIGTDPQVTPKHDASYLRATKMVPNYGYLSPTATAFSGLASAINSAPFAIGNWEPNMPGGGDVPPIGVLSHWESLYAISADPRAYAATISNNRGHGRWPVHYRDETTGRVPLHQSYSQMRINEGGAPEPPTPSGGQNGPWDIQHHPSVGYLPYLIEGRWTQLESLQFVSAFAILESPVGFRNALGNGSGIIACGGSPMTTRGSAWAQRSVGQAAAISPELGVPSADVAVGNSFRTSIDNTMTFLKLRLMFWL
jgi:hypothetical protein